MVFDIPHIPVIHAQDIQFRGVIVSPFFAKSCEFADALATGLLLPIVDVGIDLVNQLPGIGCIYVDDKGSFHLKKY
jgi:thiamine biosynthesis lipoprotein